MTTRSVFFLVLSLASGDHTNAQIHHVVSNSVLSQPQDQLRFYRATLASGSVAKQLGKISLVYHAHVLPNRKHASGASQQMRPLTPLQATARFADLPALRRQLAETDGNISYLDAQIEQLREQRAALQRERNSLSNIVDEARFEVTRFSDWNGPILTTLFGSALLAILWTDIQAISALTYYDSLKDASWLPESIKILSRLPMDLLQSYGNLAANTNLGIVLLTKACTSAVSYFLGDLVAQVFEGRNRAVLLDMLRSVRNSMLGFFLHGPLLHYWILIMEGPIASMAGGNELSSTVFLKIFLDQTIFTCVINLLYATLDNILADKSLSESFSRAKAVLVPSVVASWRFWPFVHILSYSPLIPVAFKLLWIDTMEIVWVSILSSTVNKREEVAFTTNESSVVAIPWGEGRTKLIRKRAREFANWIGAQVSQSTSAGSKKGTEPQ